MYKECKDLIFYTLVENINWRISKKREGTKKVPKRDFCADEGTHTVLN